MGLLVKLVYIITNLATGGAEIMLLKLLRHLDRSCFSPVVISLMGLGEIGPSIQALGIPVYAFGMARQAPNPFVVLRLASLLHHIKPDVVHTWMYHSDLLGGLAARLAGCRRVIWCIRHSNLSDNETSRSTILVARICSLLSRYIPDIIISCSQRSSVIHAALGYDSRKLYVVPNGFQLDRFVSDAAARLNLRAELGLTPDAPLVGLIARFDPQKNHFGFVEAASILHSQLPDVHFVLAGQYVDPGNTELARAIARMGLQDHMHLLGRRDDMPRIIAALDVLTSSSSFGEGFPNVLGEAMSCGVPCVVTDVGDSASIVGKSGRVVPPGDMSGLARGLVELLSLTPQAKAALGVQARARVEARYEIGHVTRIYESLYKLVMASTCADS